MSTKSKFTPGTWRVAKKPGEVFSSLIESAEQSIPIAECFVSANGRLAQGIKEANANARLIAAAPDMHEVIVGVAAFMKGTTKNEIEFRELIEQMDQVLKKVES